MRRDINGEGPDGDDGGGGGKSQSPNNTMPQSTAVSKPIYTTNIAPKPQEQVTPQAVPQPSVNDKTANQKAHNINPVADQQNRKAVQNKPVTNPSSQSTISSPDQPQDAQSYQQRQFQQTMANNNFVASQLNPVTSGPGGTNEGIMIGMKLTAPLMVPGLAAGTITSLTGSTLGTGARAAVTDFSKINYSSTVAATLIPSPVVSGFVGQALYYTPHDKFNNSVFGLMNGTITPKDFAINVTVGMASNWSSNKLNLGSLSELKGLGYVGFNTGMSSLGGSILSNTATDLIKNKDPNSNSFITH